MIGKCTPGALTSTGSCRAWASRRGVSTMSETVDTLTVYCRDDERVCPLPKPWQQLWEMLPEKRRTLDAWEPAIPLIGAAWHDAPADAQDGATCRTTRFQRLQCFCGVCGRMSGTTWANSRYDSQRYRSSLGTPSGARRPREVHEIWPPIPDPRTANGARPHSHTLTVLVSGAAYWLLRGPRTVRRSAGLIFRTING
jgi:hypothetical protein